MNNQFKQIGVVLGFVLICFLCYYFVLSKTINLKQEYQSLHNQELLFENMPVQLSILKKKKKHYDSILNANHLKGNSVQNNLLNLIHKHAGNSSIKVVTFLEPIVQVKEGNSVKFYQFTIQGDYNALLQLIYRLEQNTKLGEVVNLHFEKHKNFKNITHYLQASVLLKSFG